MIEFRYSEGRASVYTVVSTAIAVLGLFVLIAVAILMATGRLVVASESGVDRSSVCSRELISQYNSLGVAGSESEERRQVLEDVYSRIGSLPGKGLEDPSCVYMMLSLDMARGSDDASVKERYRVLRSLSEDGLFASSEIYNIMTVDDIGASLGELDAPGGDSGTDGAG